MQAHHPRAILCLCVLALPTVVVRPALVRGQAGTPVHDLETALRELRGKSIESIWNQVPSLRTRLQALEEGAVAELLAEERRDDFPDEAQLALASAVRTSRPEPRLRRLALTRLTSLARRPTREEVRAAAVRTLGEARESWVLPVIEGVLAAAVAEDRPELLIAASLALDRLDNTYPQRALERLLESPHYPASVHLEAAVAFAQTSRGSALDPRVRPWLELLRLEPTSRGRLARALLEEAVFQRGDVTDLRWRLRELETANRELVSRLERLDGESEGPIASDGVEELLRLIRREYVEPEQLDDPRLATDAFRRLVESLDHARLLAPEDLERQRAQELGEVLGLGVEFFKLDRRSPLVVSRRTHRPSVSTGGTPVVTLLPGDRLNAIFGVPTRGLSPTDIERLLEQTKPGSVLVEIERWGWPTPRILEIPKVALQSDALSSTLLSVDIGYVKLQRFDSGTRAALLRTVRDLDIRAGGLRGLVLDLRDNRGGLLEEAARTVDLFVDVTDRPIVTQVRGDGEEGASFTATPERSIDTAMVLLVNHHTASAAEVVAGALQDFRRAVVVGTRTYGKGVSQRRFAAPAAVARAVGGEAEVLIPDYYLRLPEGRLFHTPRDPTGRPIPGRQGGILPDVIIEQPEDALDSDELDEYHRVQLSDTVFRYVQTHFDELLNARRRAVHDLRDPAGWPEISTLHSVLRTSLTLEQTSWAAYRLLSRHLLAQEDGEPGVDVRGDSQLLEALQLLGVSEELRSSAPDPSGRSSNTPRTPSKTQGEF